MHIVVHDAVKEHVAIYPYERSSSRGRPGDLAWRAPPIQKSGLGIRVPVTQQVLANRTAYSDRHQRDKRGTQICMGKPVQDVVASQDAYQGFDIYRDLAEAKHHQAEAPTEYGFHRQAGTHVEWRDWHRGESTGLTLRMGRASHRTKTLIPARHRVGSIGWLGGKLN